jgi:hypothetical protein
MRCRYPRAATGSRSTSRQIPSELAKFLFLPDFFCILMWPFPRKRTAMPSPAARVSRPRSLPSAIHFHASVALCCLHYGCLVAMATTAVMLVQHPNPKASRVLVATVAATLFTWLIAYFKRRQTMCPLCKGTPLIESGALLHDRARRIPFLPHGSSSVLHILFTQKFRCMYCGTDYDLLKEPSRSRAHRKPR